MDLETLRELKRLLRPIETRLKLLATRAVVSLVRDALNVQSVQVTGLVDEVDEVEHLQPGGLTHVPLGGADGIYLSIGGDRGNGVVIAVSERSGRPKELESGETALYSVGEEATQILIKADGTVEIGKGTDLTPVALANKVATELAKISSVITGLGGSYTPASTAASKTKAL